ncbi:MAG: aromatic ring-hydroxylating dioxygenase subunit alpha [Gammaproteobacteria bacterium]
MASVLQPRTGCDALVEAVRAAARCAPTEARALPAGCYLDPAFHALERTRIFDRAWQAVAHVSQLRAPGDFVTLDLIDEPLIVVRGRDDRIRVLSRVCQHRGLDIVPPGATRADGTGHVPALKCPYHLWKYDLAGRLVAAPEMEGSVCHAHDRVALPEFRSEIYAGFVFVTFDRAARPLAESLGAVADSYLAKFDLARAELVWQQHWACDFNWKVLAENFMEPYHHLGAHRTTLQPFLPAKHCATEPASNDDFLAVRLPLHADIRARLAAGGTSEPGFTSFAGLAPQDHLDWWVTLAYPTFLLFLAPDRAFWYRLLPTGPETCSLLTTLLVPPGACDAPGYAALRARAEQEAIAFHLEDMAICNAMQRGFRARGYTRGALSPLEEPILHIHRYLARQLG